MPTAVANHIIIFGPVTKITGLNRDAVMRVFAKSRWTLSRPAYAAWYGPEAFPSLVSMYLGGNQGLAGTLPPFGKAGSFASLQTLNLSGCSFTGDYTM